MKKFLAFAPVLVVLLLRAEGPSNVVFHDVTSDSGILFNHSIGDDQINTIVEATGSGCAFLDYDGDGWLDVYAVNGRYLEGINDPESRVKGAELGNRLFRNRGDGTFEDVTAKAGVADGGYGMGVAVGDYDNDGRPDLFVTNFSGNSLYHNNGNGTFDNVTERAGVRGDGSWSVGAVFFDYDKDSRLDLFVGNYLEFDPKYRLYYEADVYPGPLSYPPLPSTLYHNKGDGTFENVTAKAGITKKGRAMGVLSADCNDDGWPDLFVANDATQNFLYRNNGDGTFTEVGLDSGVAFAQHGNAVASMGGDFGDFDMDGHLDIVVPAMNYISLFQGLGKGLFEDVSVNTGVARASAQFWSWGGDFVDYDNDGDLDVLVVNGDGHRLSEKQEQLLLRNDPGPDGTRTLIDASRSAGGFFDTRMVARGMATGDFDNDGDSDFFVLNIDQPSKLLRNDGGNHNNWIRIQLTGTKSNRDGIGARVTVRSGDWKLTEERMSSTSYLSQNDPRLLFGLGARKEVDEVEIRWPAGTVQRVKSPAINQTLKAVEP